MNNKTTPDNQKKVLKYAIDNIKDIVNMNAYTYRKLNANLITADNDERQNILMALTINKKFQKTFNDRKIAIIKDSDNKMLSILKQKRDSDNMVSETAGKMKRLRV